MLERLIIRNYALIGNSDIRFGAGLNIITGETGAGKSILLGALGLVLGDRADLSLVTDREKKCVIEAVFLLDQKHFEPWFLKHELDFSNETIIRRELTPSGNSRAFINDTPVLLPVLKDLGEQLIDIHSQHENLGINSQTYQLQLLDHLAGQRKQAAQYNTLYAEYRQLLRQLSALKDAAALEASMAEFNRFQLDELEHANLKPDELKEAEEELEVLSNATQIRTALESIRFNLDEKEESILSSLSSIRQLFREASAHTGAADLASRFEGALIELQDIAAEAGRLAEDVSGDPAREELLGGRIDLINGLLQKHKLKNEADLINLREDLSTRVSLFESSGDDIAALEQKINNSLAQLAKAGAVLSEGRRKASVKAAEKAGQLLKGLGMPHARLDIELINTELPGESGFDQCRFLFTANKGGTPGEIARVASGGELSRVMFCIKALTAGQPNAPVLVFDEIDTGVSGEVADRLGSMMADLAEGRQLVAITHLPQVASKGNNHLFVYKEIAGGRTWSHVKSLNEKERVEEIAGMLSGTQVTDAAVAQARALLKR